MKVLGRISFRFSRDFGDEVVGVVLVCLLVIESDLIWYGVCLVLVEFV